MASATMPNLYEEPSKKPFKKKKKNWDAENRRELVGVFGALNEKKV
jgi:hypothetical protein